jgi:hypothetical protein
VDGTLVARELLSGSVGIVIRILLTVAYAWSVSNLMRMAESGDSVVSLVASVPASEVARIELGHPGETPPGNACGSREAASSGRSAREAIDVIDVGVLGLMTGSGLRRGSRRTRSHRQRRG